MKSVALPFGDGSVQVQLPDRAQVAKAGQPNVRIAAPPALNSRDYRYIPHILTWISPYRRQLVLFSLVRFARHYR